MSNIALPYTQIIDPASFKSVLNAKIYIGEYGVLPNPNNSATWKQAYFVQDDGSRVAASQPVRTNAAGFAVDGSGNIRTVQVDGQYSLLIQDSLNVQKYSNTRVADLIAEMQNSTDPAKGAEKIGYNIGGIGSVGRTQASKNKDVVSAKDFGAFGDGASHPLSTRFATLAEAQALNNVNTTSLTDELDAFAIQCAIDYVWHKGGGAVYIPAGHYLGANFQSVVMRPFVTVYGDGAASFLDYNWNAVLAPSGEGSNVTNTSWKAISGISGNVVTLSTSSDAAGFTVDTRVFLSSGVLDDPSHPSFFEIVSITAVDTVNGKLVLDAPIVDSITTPQIGTNALDATMPIWAYGELHSLRLKSAPNNGPFFPSGTYKCHVYNIWTEGIHGIIANAITHSTIENFNCVVNASATALNNLVLEVKYGSHNSTFRNINAVVNNTDGTSSLMNMISIGERCRDITTDDIKIYAPACNAELFGSVKSVRGKHSNIKAWLANATRCIFFASSTGGSSIPVNGEVKNVDIYVSGLYGAGVKFNGGDVNTEKNISVENINIYGTQGAYGGESAGGIYFGANSSNCSVKNADINGYVTAFSQARLYNSLTSGPLDVTSRNNIEMHECKAIYGSFIPPSPAQAFAVNTSSTTANNPMVTMALPINYPYIVGDKITVRAIGEVVGTNGSKNIAIADNAGAYYTLTIAASTTGIFQIEAEIVVIGIGSGNVSTRSLGKSVQGTTLATFQNQKSITTNAANNIMIQAWVANAADGVLLYDAEIQWSDKFRSVKGGSDAWNS